MGRPLSPSKVFGRDADCTQILHLPTHATNIDARASGHVLYMDWHAPSFGIASQRYGTPVGTTVFDWALSEAAARR